MKTLVGRAWAGLLALVLTASLAAPSAFGQDAPPAPPAFAFSQQDLDRLLAPIALYPDALLSQILMASTYPLEVAEAARWSRDHPGLAGDHAVRAVDDKDWDPSVKSLTAFPQILAMMDENRQWTENLGEAFLAQEPHVMETVQQLRQKAYAAGHLKSTEQLNVIRRDQTIVVEPAHPEVVYVPYYDPFVVYGPWWYPAHPPFYWRPWPGYYVRPGVSFGFYWGPPVRVSPGFFFGRFDWPRRHVQVVHANNYYYARRPLVVERNVIIHNAPRIWAHDPGHRRGAPYRVEAVRQHFARTHVAPSQPRRVETVTAPSQPRRVEIITAPSQPQREIRAPERAQRRPSAGIEIDRNPGRRPGAVIEQRRDNVRAEQPRAIMREPERRLEQPRFERHQQRPEPAHRAAPPERRGEAGRTERRPEPALNASAGSARVAEHRGQKARAPERRGRGEQRGHGKGGEQRR